MYELKYIHGMEPVGTANAIQRGLSYHGKVEKILDYQSDWADDNLKTNAMAMAFEAYILPQLRKRHVVGVEGWFEYSLLSGKIKGRYDALCNHGIIVEHKTTSGLIDGAYLQRLEMDEQIPTYLIASGGNLVCYTICSTPSIRQRKNESDAEFQQRCFDWYEDGNYQKITMLELYRSDEQLEKFRQEQNAIVEEMANCKNYYRNPSHCTKFGRLCEYAPICMNYDPEQEYIQFRMRDGYNDETGKTGD